MDELIEEVGTILDKYIPDTLAGTNIKDNIFEEVEDAIHRHRRRNAIDVTVTIEGLGDFKEECISTAKNYYNKAVDDFAKELVSMIKTHRKYEDVYGEYVTYYYIEHLTYTDIYDISEKLKGGVNNV